MSSPPVSYTHLDVYKRQLLFCTTRYGWGWKNFKEEANEGGGLKIRNWMRFYVSYILPLIVIALFVIGIKDKFFP